MGYGFLEGGWRGTEPVWLSGAGESGTRQECPEGSCSRQALVWLVAVGPAWSRAAERGMRWDLRNVEGARAG